MPSETIVDRVFLSCRHSPQPLTIIGVFLTLIAACALGQGEKPLVAFSSHGHSHNDYAHSHPLADALAQNFTSVEADIFLVGDELLVGHTTLELDPARTLKALYLDPLQRRFREAAAERKTGRTPLYLLIDVKSDADTTFDRLHRLLSEYAEMLTVVRAGNVIPGAVTIVLSGNRAIDRIKSEEPRLVMIDGRPEDLDASPPPNLVPWISAPWNQVMVWSGEGEVPAGERQKLLDHVERAHAQHRQVRFWGTPDVEAVWRLQRECGVDWINTDRLEALHRFLGD